MSKGRGANGRLKKGYKLTRHGVVKVGAKKHRKHRRRK